ncbi:MAG: P-loop NTPase fold protein [Flavobacteriales bacterium]
MDTPTTLSTVELPPSIEEAFKLLQRSKSLLESYRTEDLSETDTRSKIIDFFFKDILGWKEEHIKREGSVARGFFDYRFNIPGFNFVVEAKRNFQDIKLPPTQKHIQLKFFATENKQIWEQTQKYCIDTGVPNGVITNGHQFFIGQFNNNDGTDWRKNRCLVFDGLKDIEDRFMEFYTNLSLPGIVHHGGYSFNYSQSNRLGPRILASLTDGDKEINRNSLSGHLQPVIDRLFGEMFSSDIADDLDFVKRCFVDNEETKQNRNEIDKLFADVPPSLTAIVPARHTSSLNKQISYEIKQDEKIARDTLPPKPIIAIGSKGSGKTTFINHLFKFKFTETRPEDFPWVYIDFREYQDRIENFEQSAIAKDIISKIYARYGGYNLHTFAVLQKIYEKEIRLKNEGGWSQLKQNFPTEYHTRLIDYLDKLQEDYDAHLIAISNHLIKDRRKRLIIIIDNTDQFSDAIQERVFLFAHALNRTARCGVVISLREGYYYKWRNAPPFDAYESNVYHISAPPYAQVLGKRLDYAIASVNEKNSTTSISDDGKTISIRPATVQNFLKLIKESLFTPGNTKIVDFLSFTTHTNIREGLRIFKIFLTSGHTDVADVALAGTAAKSGKGAILPQIRLFEFLRAVGLQNKVYYNHTVSVIPNLFFPCEGGDSHFMKIYILKHLELKRSDEGEINKYQPYTLIMALFAGFGFKSYLVQQEIAELLKLGLIDSQ